MLEDDLLVLVLVCTLPMLAIAGLYVLGKRFVGPMCPACRQRTLVGNRDLPSLRPLFANYVCRNCGKDSVKFFLPRSARQ